MPSACEPHRPWIEVAGPARAQRPEHLPGSDRTARIPHRYNSVKRFVARLQVRDPERFDVLEFLPGEEAQVDLGLGAPTLRTGQVPPAVPVRDDA